MVALIELQTLPTPELKKMLAESLLLTAERLLRVAEIVAELDRRGEDFGKLRTAMIRYLRAIAAKTLLPEIVVEYAGRPAILNRLSLLPIEKQQSVLDDPSKLESLTAKPKKPVKKAIGNGKPHKETSEPAKAAPERMRVSGKLVSVETYRPIELHILTLKVTESELKKIGAWIGMGNQSDCFREMLHKCGII